MCGSCQSQFVKHVLGRSPQAVPQGLCCCCFSSLEAWEEQVRIRPSLSSSRFCDPHTPTWVVLGTEN